MTPAAFGGMVKDRLRRNYPSERKEGRKEGDRKEEGGCVKECAHDHSSHPSPAKLTLRVRML